MNTARMGSSKKFAPVRRCLHCFGCLAVLQLTTIGLASAQAPHAVSDDVHTTSSETASGQRSPDFVANLTDDRLSRIKKIDQQLRANQRPSRSPDWQADVNEYGEQFMTLPGGQRRLLDANRCSGRHSVGYGRSDSGDIRAYPNGQPPSRDRSLYSSPYAPDCPN